MLTKVLTNLLQDVILVLVACLIYYVLRYNS